MLTATTTLVTPTVLPESPYPGIEAFRYVDEPIFFAREEETERLLRYVSVYRGVLFYGESGCGKSSLLNAGFIPAVIAEGFTPDRLRVQPKPGAEIIVERISTKDTGEPPYLPSNFALDDDPQPRLVHSAAEVSKRLQAGVGSSPTRRPILIFDQFEEFATLFEEAPHGEALQHARQAQQAILDLIVELQRHALPIKLLFSFREDYLAKLSKLIALWPALSDQSQRLTSPSTDSLSTIIRGSFEKYPGSFGKELPVELTNNLSAALKARNESGKINLSEVQIACLQLWKSNNPQALFKTKSVHGLLEEYLSDSLNHLGPDLRDPATALLSRMVTPSGTRNIVSEYDLISQVKKDEGISEERLKQALGALVQETKLVRRERRYDTYFYDIVSEFLVPWITRQKVDRLAALERRKLEAIEKRKRNRAFVLALSSLALTVGVALTAVYIIKNRNQTIEFQKQNAFLKVLQEKTVQDAQAAQAVAEKDRALEMLAHENTQKQYDGLRMQYTALEQSSNDQKSETDKLKQQTIKLQSDLDRTRAKFAETSEGLADLDWRLGQVFNKLVKIKKPKDPMVTDAEVALGQIEKRLRGIKSKVDAARK